MVTHFSQYYAENLKAFINITEFNQTSGLYYESYGPLRISQSTWQLISYLDLKNYQQRHSLILGYYNQTVRHCRDASENSKDIKIATVCTQFVQITLPYLNEIEFNHITLSSMLNLKGNSSSLYSRQKRGLANFVGRIANVLFGVCSDQDAEYFYNKISELQENKEKILRLSKEQIHIMKSVVHHTYNSSLHLDQTQQNMSRNIQKLLSQSQMNADKINLVEFISTLAEHTATITLLLSQYSWETQNLLAIVNSALSGRLHSSILPPNILLNELKEIRLSLPSTLELPVSIYSTSLTDLFKITTIDALYINYTLIFNLKIPLLSNLDFNLFHPISLPIPQGNQNFIFIVTESKYLALSRNNDYYFSLSDLQLSNCFDLSNFKLCKYSKALYRHSKTKNCDVNLYFKPNYPIVNCNLKYRKLFIPIYHKLEIQNSWLYVTPIETHMTFKCNNVQNLFSINTIGKITVDKSCTVSTETSVLLPSQNIISVSPKTLFPRIL
ncbi:uncharacterized protein LOC126898201 [Daktulosphaira vitifoliae]|uniref:uncharacterized protein LOC126898201 n=1 Tax=Daktulosphaira vitifoliae TaxID=58002 RepID=UPI0021A996BD|nr:uncharacterized protein LOC126898201 [Daktulosphaira vitifoliae]